MTELASIEQQQKSRGCVTLVKVFGIILLLLLLCSGSALFWLYSYSTTPGPSDSSEVIVMIPRGASFTSTATLLVDAGLVQEDIRFHILARLYGLSGKVRAGEFSLTSGMKPMETLKALIEANPLQHAVTIVEGLRAEEIAEVFARDGWVNREEFMGLVYDKEFISSLNVGEITSLEGYLYPDTYYLSRLPAPDTKKIIKIMVQRFLEIWKSLDVDVKKMHKTVILASIVEKETGDASERSRIASVFWNRLRKGMRLQSDPTVIYGITDFDGNITRKDLRRETPYNTYVIKGLPFGPICNPGKAALDAVLNPADEKYLYFVSKNDGTHHFSKTLREHNRAVRKYQLKK
ncbi:MAG: endolytic transglycosylase MltG [Desulfocapsaceae bacterium]|nr:endolytic transglycosylase MltG [Desulfocapsaceae bacterium]